MKTSGLRAVYESPQTTAAAIALAMITHKNVELHFSNGEKISSRITLIRNNHKKSDELIVELKADATRRLSLFIPLDNTATVYAKVWPR